MTMLAKRVCAIEKQLSRLSSALERYPSLSIGAEDAEQLRSTEQPADSDDTTDPLSSDGGGAHPGPGPTEELSYMGETSIRRTLQEVEDSLHELGLPVKDADAPTVVSPDSALTSETSATSSRSLRTWVLKILAKYQLCPRKADWVVLLDLYCDYVHPLYPFLHIPSLRRSYAQLVGETDVVTAGKESFAQVLLCLALGRCTTSVRAETNDGMQSSGWAFHAAALECVKDVVDPLGDTPASLSRLHVLTLMVVYLFRIDASERAHKVLSLTIIQAQHLGLHREAVLETATTFVAESSRRLWWCLYILDRRLSLTIGQPFVIQDTNMDTKLPLLLSETAMDALFHCPATSGPEDDSGCDDAQSPIPNLIAMVGYSKIAGKAWNNLYQAQSMDRASEPTLIASFEDLLSMWKHGLPPSLNCDEMRPCQDHIPGPPARGWQPKNRFLIVIRTLWLRILIRKPMCSRSSPNPWMTTFDNDAACVSLADRIIAFYSRIVDPYGIYTFPFIEYLLGAASTALGLIVKVPVFRLRHTHSVMQATHMLNTFCTKTWVSGKTLRSVKRFTDMMTDVINQCNNPRSLQPRNARSRDSNPPGTNGASNATSRKYSLEGSSQNATRLEFTAAPTGTLHGHSAVIGEQTRAVNADGNAHGLEGGTSSYHYPIMSSPHEMVDLPSFGPGPDFVGSFAPGLESLVITDYAFERSVADQNIMQGSGYIPYEDIAAGMLQ
ncbi:fungal specific transcription factor domain-containing protein [Aspergillus mulundensis]|uniref:Putative transcriptional regulatory protein n=1 Tax=Aspergillus mulundensis TaxID=1810919 RepID=A0A3D8RYX3_9EURO|nr:putative transcriptional regulatory protein [Aspergillus mulundensis]RDW79236.1 putative transcriptional regulatory protein [Aspergillus mulundensis]